MELLYTNEAGVTTKYTEEMLVAALKGRDLFDKENQRLTAIRAKLQDELSTIRGEVFDFFNERYESGATSIEIEVSDINELLESIGCLKLKSLFKVSGVISFTICDVEAEDQDAAGAEVADYLSYDYQGSGLVDTFEVQIDEID